MKIFKYKFTRLTLILIYVGIALSVVTIGINIYSICTTDIASAAKPAYPIIQFTLMFLIPVVLLIVLVSLLISSYYAIDGSILKTSFGIIKSKYKIAEIQTVILDRTTNKLSIGMTNNTYFVIVVREEWYNDFIDALCKANAQIEFAIQSKENDGSKPS